LSRREELSIKAIIRRKSHTQSKKKKKCTKNHMGNLSGGVPSGERGGVSEQGRNSRHNKYLRRGGDFQCAAGSKLVVSISLGGRFVSNFEEKKKKKKTPSCAEKNKEEKLSLSRKEYR